MTTAGNRKRIALSFDDVPRAPGGFFTPAERTERLISALAEARVEQAVFFVTTGQLDLPHGAGGEERIAAYAAAGHVIANHSHSHRPLTLTDAAAYMADIDRAEQWLRGRPGYRPWYRFTYLDEGAGDPVRRDAVRMGLARRGLSNGYITADSYDWFLDDLAGRARQADRPVDLAALGELYSELVVRAVEFADALARATIGRSPSHVLLLHETDLAAIGIAGAVKALRANGWETVAIDRAYADPIAGEEPQAAYLAGGRVAAIANARGRAPRELIPEWNNEATISRLFNARVLHLTEAA